MNFGFAGFPSSSGNFLNRWPKNMGQEIVLLRQISGGSLRMFPFTLVSTSFSLSKCQLCFESFDLERAPL